MRNKPENIRFFFQQQISLNNRKKLKTFILNIFKKEGKSVYSLNYIFCSDQQLLKINQQFLKHNLFTDIISFNLSEKPDIIEGEIYISVNRVRENAQSFKVPVKVELLRVIFHGALHSCGYDDKTKAELLVMRKNEDKLITAYLKTN
jgi:rRNA maturation RNase YbeY